MLRGEFGAALATAGAEDGTAGAGAHAQTETVHLGATTVVRLERSLAHSQLLHVLDLHCGESHNRGKIGARRHKSTY